jgi:hypothetical protein
MVKDDNGKASPYPGPDGAYSDKELLSEKGGVTTTDKGGEKPADPAVDEAEKTFNDGKAD